MNSYKHDMNDFGFGNSGLDDDDDGASARKRKRKSRWATEEDDKTFIPGMPTVLPSGLEKDQEELYLLQLQIEEISRRLRTGDLGIPTNPEERSPSPEPIYNNEGKRLNTREYRTRKKLEEQRHELIQRCCSLNEEYKPPSDYKPPVIKVTDKVMIPQEEHPDINFVGLLIGPRGNTLKNLEKDTGAKIIIRGKGSVKEGKIGRKDGQPLPGEDEPLHAYITANNPEFVKKAAIKIRDIIKQGIEVPEQQNDLRRQQLRELALLNGTLRENDGLMKLKQLQQAQTIITNTILCTKCGGTGHLGQDCKQARPGDTLRSAISGQTGSSSTIGGHPGAFRVDKAKMDSEYSALMAELGEGPPTSRENKPASRPSVSMSSSDNYPDKHQSHFSSPPPGIAPPNMQQPPPPFNHKQHHHHGNRPPFNQPPPNNNFQPPHSRPPMNLPPPTNCGPPPNMGNQHNIPPHSPMSSSNSMSHQGPPPPMMSSPPPLMSQHTQPPPTSGAPPLPPWQQSPNQPQHHGPPPPVNSGPPGMPPPPPNMGAPPPPPPPGHNLPPWQQGPPQQQQQQAPNNYGMHHPPGGPPPMAPWLQQGPPPPGPPHGGRPPWHHGPPPPPLMGHNHGPPPPPHMMPPPPPPGQQSFSPSVAPPPPPPGQGDASGGGGGLPAGIPLGVPPPPPPS